MRPVHADQRQHQRGRGKCPEHQQVPSPRRDRLRQPLLQRHHFVGHQPLVDALQQRPDAPAPTPADRPVVRTSATTPNILSIVLGIGHVDLRFRDCVKPARSGGQRRRQRWSGAGHLRRAECGGQSGPVPESRGAASRSLSTTAGSLSAIHRPRVIRRPITRASAADVELTTMGSSRAPELVGGNLRCTFHHETLRQRKNRAWPYWSPPPRVGPRSPSSSASTLANFRAGCVAGIRSTGEDDLPS